LIIHVSDYSSISYIPHPSEFYPLSLHDALPISILAADVVGYSRLMGANETGTLAALKELRTDFIDGKIAEHQGRIVKLTGDGMLDRKSTRLNSSHLGISYAVFCLKKKNNTRACQ